MRLLGEKVNCHPEPQPQKMGHDALMTGIQRDSSLRFAAFGKTPGRADWGDDGAAKPPHHHPNPPNKLVIPTRSGGIS